MAAGMGNPLFAHTESEVKQLDEVRTKAAEWVKEEKVEAYETAAKLAVTENYDEYNKFEGRVMHKNTG